MTIAVIFVRYFLLTLLFVSAVLLIYRVNSEIVNVVSTWERAVVLGLSVVGVYHIVMKIMIFFSADEPNPS